MIAGRGAGKTDACAAYIDRHVNGPPCLSGPIPHWIGIIAPTLGDAATSCYAGPSGIRAHSPGAKLANGPGGLTVKWPNGSEAKLFGAHTPDDVERLRSGGNRCVVWAEELAAWRYLDDAWNHMRFGLRVGRRPHWIASTTPKPKALIKRLAAGEERNVVVTTASTYDNPHLEQHIRDQLEETYGGTQLGQQELLGMIMDQDENALWTRTMIDAARVRPGDVPDLTRVTVGVDPSGGAGEQGIIVAGKSGLVLPGEGGRPQHHGYVLDDRTCRLPPDGWGRRAVQAAVDWEADEIAVEINYGAAMAVSVISAAAESMGVDIPIRQLTASRGKRVRAEPVSALTAQGRWHHAGTFPELEDQLATWYPEIGWSPDRLDAMVWTTWQMKLVGTSVRGVGSLGGDMARRKIVPGQRR
jgi:phage terminase large subunit-like protein